MSKAHRMAGNLRTPRAWSMMIVFLLGGCPAGFKDLQPDGLFESAAVSGGNYPEAYACERIAVASFTGDQGPWIAGQVEGRLHRLGHYQLVDRRALDEAVGELKRQHGDEINNTPTFDRSTAVSLGEIVGADCFLSGSVSLAKVERKPYEERLCDVMGAKVPVPSEDLCPGTMQDTSCEGLTADAVLVPRLVDVRTGAVVFAQTATGQASDRSCEGSRLHNAASETELQQTAIDKAIDVIVADLTPKAPTANY